VFLMRSELPATPIGADLLAHRAYLCRRCRADLTESLRGHLYACNALPEEMRLRAAASDGGHCVHTQRQAQGQEAHSVSRHVLPHLGRRKAYSEDLDHLLHSAPFNASHAARCVAFHGVRSHAVPVALVGECSILVVALQPRSSAATASCNAGLDSRA
jgi:hypothetical protein